MRINPSPYSAAQRPVAVALQVLDGATPGPDGKPLSRFRAFAARVEAGGDYWGDEVAAPQGGEGGGDDARRNAPPPSLADWRDSHLARRAAAAAEFFLLFRDPEYWPRVVDVSGEEPARPWWRRLLVWLRGRS